MKKKHSSHFLICGLMIVTCFILIACGKSDSNATTHEVTASDQPDPEAENYKVNDGVITEYTGPGGEITIPATISGETITAIGEKAFYANETVTGVTISKGIKEIGAEAFMYSKIEKLDLGSVEKIGEAAFRFAPLVGVTIPDTVTEMDFQCFASLTHADHGNGKLYIPASLKSIPDEAFIFTRFDTIEFESATLPEMDVKTFDNSGVVKIVLPDSVTTEEIPEYTEKFKAAGMYESNLSFWNTKGDELVIVYEDFSDRFRYNDSEGWLIEYIGNDETLVLPTEINGQPITVICSELFAKNTTVKKVIIPKGYIEIESYAFSECENLESVILEEGLEIIGNGAFKDCTKLESFVIPDSVTTIGNGVFMGCTSLKEVTLNNTITEIPETAFGICSSLEYISFPDNIKSISKDAFWQAGLKTIDFNKVETLGDSCFSCTKITEVTVPGTVKVIPTDCFENCVSLAKITLEDGVERIEEGAFTNCGRDSEKQVGFQFLFEEDQNSDPNILPNQEDYQSIINIYLPGSLQYIGPHFVENCYVEGVYMLDVKKPDDLPEFDIDAFTGSGLVHQIFFEKDVIDQCGTELDQFLMGLNNMTDLAWYDDGTRMYWGKEG